MEGDREEEKEGKEEKKENSFSTFRLCGISIDTRTSCGRTIVFLYPVKKFSSIRTTREPSNTHRHTRDTQARLIKRCNNKLQQTFFELMSC